MSLFITSLNSGSNGNCYYIANEQEAVLVDVGISCREVIKRMARLGLSIEKVKAIFISHEHSDHINGVRVLATKFGLPVYITPLTLKNSGLFLPEQLIRHFSTYQIIHIGNLSVTPFPKMHDCVDGHSFIVSGNQVNIGVLTDIGSICEHVISNFKRCNAVFLEANYDETMLDEGNYPWYLKNRIRSGKGHLSNKQALEFFLAHKPNFMSHVFLSHLSKQNNHPELVYNLFAKYAANTEVVVAARTEETPIYQIQSVNSLTSTSMNTFDKIKEDIFFL
jgi:phosphoribosyl 1,2-cyclic phosphodiesterase